MRADNYGTARCMAITQLSVDVSSDQRGQLFFQQQLFVLFFRCFDPVGDLVQVRNVKSD
jgi:hypothetical protein